MATDVIDNAPEILPVRRDAAYFRDLYQDRLDFQALAQEDADLDAFLHHGQLDFRDPRAVRQLTTTLLRRDFGLAIDLPPDRLCPPVPNRHAYVRWVQALLDSTTGALTGPEATATTAATAETAACLDIGTGASCIYPLLACAQRPGWRFLATDVDAASLASARANVARNGFASDRIHVLARTPADPLVPLTVGVSDGGDGCDDVDDVVDGAGVDHRFTHLDATMTNPPFYASAAEMAAAAAAKRQPPHAACTGAPVEMVYADGGEVAFVGRLLDESAVLRCRVAWYTVMLGKLTSLVTLVDRLRARGIDNYAVAALVVGRKTRRWVMAWSYGARRPTVAVARGGGSGTTSGTTSSSTGFESCRHILPPITEADVWRVPTASDGASLSVTAMAAAVDAAMRALELVAWSWDAQTLRGVGRAHANVWGRAWRRKRQREPRPPTTGFPGVATSTNECALSFAITIVVGVAETTVHCRWLEGHNEALYQSFCGFLRTKINESSTSAGHDTPSPA